MIGSIICSFLILYQAIYIIRKISFDRAIIFYLIFSMISPNLNIGGIIIGFELLAFPLVMIHYIIVMRSLPIPSDVRGLPLLMYTILVIVVSLISVAAYSIAVPVVAMYAVIRYLFTFQMVRSRKVSNWIYPIDKIFTVTLVVNVIYSIIQVSFSQSVDLFVSLYGKASNAVLYNIQAMGYFNRAVGTFGSPTLLGPFALICFSFYLSLVFNKEKRNSTYIKLILSLILGTLALSKTFIIGVPIMTVIVLLSARKKFKPRIIFGFVVLIILILLIVYFGYDILTQKTAINSKLIEYYFGMLSDPIKAFQTRYSNVGNLQESMNVFMDNPIFGVGLNAIKNEFTGDSAYIQLLHNTGLAGLILMSSFILGVFYSYHKKRDRVAFTVILAALIAGISIPILTEIMLIVPLGYSLAKPMK